jgi:hypothetical protein
MKLIEETVSNDMSKANKEVARYNRKVMWYVTKRTAKQVLVVGAAILATKVVFDAAVQHEVNKQISS